VGGRHVRVPDPARRIRFLYGHLAALRAPIEQGVPVIGYTQEPIKDGGGDYAKIAGANALEAE
jgi:hypothetical protein